MGRIGHLFRFGGLGFYLACGVVAAGSFAFSYIDYKFGGIQNFATALYVRRLLGAPMNSEDHIRVSRRTRFFDHSQLSEYDLPEAEKASAPSGAKGVFTKPEELLVRLVGIDYSDVANPEVVIEDESSRRQEVFQEGDSVFSRANLIAIRKDSILLEGIDGARAILRLQGGSIEEEPADMGARRNSLTPDPTVRKFEGKDVYLIARAEKEFLIRAFVRSHFHNSFSPEERDGQVLGLRYTAGQGEDGFRLLGLKSGDIVKVVNEIPLHKARDFAEVIPTLRAQWADVVIERGGEEISLSVTVNN